ncbi:MAG TPA: ABC transporter permease [Candidatus Baltobacteraceae bacterium]|jgi:lipoprotein-releasing system permease protein|nr:ABC transporter permease [Candidatus Baltobacteraceae bacterium]
MTFEWLVALRYLRSPNRPAVLRLVTLLAVLGVAAGVTTLVVALSMNTGFRQAIRDRLLSVTAHVNIKPVSPQGIEDYKALIAKLSGTPGVQSIVPAIYSTVLLSSGTHPHPLVLKGVDPELERNAGSALKHIVSGTDQFAPDADGIPALVIGHLMAEDLKISAGDYVTLISPQGNLTPFGMLPLSRRFRVVGIFDSGFYDYDANWGFVTLKSAQSLAGVGDVVSLLEVRVKNLDDARKIADELVRRAGPGYYATTWMDENRALFRALSLEKLVTALFIGLITFVAGLNILVVLTMTVTDRAKDIAVLMAVGARRHQIRRIFILQGLAISIAGTAAGLAAGFGFSWIANRWQLIPLNPEVYAIPYVPFHSNGTDAIWIAVAALAISIAATVLPARSASNILPVDILRFE